MRRVFTAALAAAGLLVVTGCSLSPATLSPAAVKGTGAPVGPPGAQAAGVLRLGFDGDLTDAAALVGLQMGFFGENLGTVSLEPTSYSSVAQEVSALGEGQLDAAYLDPVSALQVWQAAPDSIKIVSGAASGGAELVVSSAITSAAQLKGHVLAAPGGGTQQAAADHWLSQQGLSSLAGTERQGAASASTGVLQQFTSGKIAGGWEFPPLSVQMTDAGGRVLVNEASTWTGGQFPTAVLVVTQQYLAANPPAVTGLLKGQIEADDFLSNNQLSAAAAVNQRLTSTGDTLPAPVISQSLSQLTFTDSPLPGSLATEAQNAANDGLLKPVNDLSGAYDLDPLNQILQGNGQQPIAG